MKLTADDVNALIALYKAATARATLHWALYGPAVDTFAVTLTDTAIHAAPPWEGQGDTLGDAIRMALRAMEGRP